MNEVIDQVRTLARDYARTELRPHVEAWDRDRRLDPAVLSQLAELGFFGMLVPETHGGMGFDLPTYVTVLEELAWGEPAVALTVSIHSAFVVGTILRHGSDTQKEQWLGRLASGETLGCFALSEPDAGSDAAALETRAVRDGDGWVLSGTKKWLTNAALAGLAVVAARVDGRIALFLVPTDADGFEIVGRETTMGLRALDVSTVELRNVRVGPEALLGDPSRGFAYAMAALDLGRMGIAAQAVGIARAALEHAVGYADERTQFGQKIRDFEGMQFKLADMATRVEAARSLTLHAAAEPSTRNSAMAKVFASETAMWVTTQAVQVYGGYGYMRDYPVEKLMRDARAMGLIQGADERLRLEIASSLYDD